jgi:hypothetical protein
MTPQNDVAAEEPARPILIWQRADEQDIECAVSPERPVTIGREATNTITVESPFISKAHAIVQFANGVYVVEDLQSANGTRVNGASIESAVIQPGDVIEIGEERFLFADGAAGHTAGGSNGLGKNAKLALAGVGSLVVIGGLMLLLVGGRRPQAPTAAPTTTAGSSATVQASPEAPVPTETQADSAQVIEVVARAEKAGVSPVDALFDEAMLQHRGGRLRDAVQMLSAVQARAPQHPIAGKRLSEIRRELERAITDHGGQAAQAFSQLRYDAAVKEWGQVLLLADSPDPRHRDALDGIERAHLRGAR